MKYIIAFCMIIILTACTIKSSSQPPPTSLAMVIETAVLPTATYPPSATFLPTSTHSPTPTKTATSTSTSTPVPTSTPAPTVIPANIGIPVHKSSSMITMENANQVTKFARWGRGVIYDVAYSGNGRWIAVGTATGIYIHDAQDLKIEPIHIETEGHIESLDISPNGEMVAIGFRRDRREYFVELWSVEEHELLWLKEEWAHAIRFSPDGEFLSAGHVVWHAWNGKEAHRIMDNVLSTQFSPDGEKFAAWSYGTLSIYDWPSGELISQTEPILYVNAEEDVYPADGSVISDVQFATDGEPILLNLQINTAYGITGRAEFQRGSDDSLLLSIPPVEPLSEPIQDICNEPYIYGDPPTSPSVWQFEFAPESGIVALLYQDRGYGDDDKNYTTVHFYQLHSGHQLYTQAWVQDIAFSPDGKTWVSGLNDGRLQIRRIIDGAVLQTIDGYESIALDVVISPDNQMVAVQYEDEVKLYDANDGIVLRRYPAGKIALSPDSSVIALGDENGRIELRDVTDDSLLDTLSSHTDSITSLLFLPSGNELVSAGMDCQLNVWELENGIVSYQLENWIVETPYTKNGYVRVWDMIMSDDGKTIIGEFYSSIGLWPQQNGTFETTLEVTVVSNMDANPFLPNELIDFYDRVIYIGAERLDNASSEEITAIYVAPNGHYFASSSLDGVIRLWGVP